MNQMKSVAAASRASCCGVPARIAAKTGLPESDNIVCGKNLLILVSSSTSCATVDPAVQGVHRCQASHTARKLVANNYSDIP